MVAWDKCEEGEAKTCALHLNGTRPDHPLVIH